MLSISNKHFSLRPFFLYGALVFCLFAPPIASGNEITLPGNPPFFHKEENDMLVIFVHGITGHHTDTWTWGKSKPPFFWPEQLFKDPVFAGHDVLSFGYKSDCGISYDIKQISQSLKMTIDELMQAKRYKAISFVGHSLGGLVTRKFILDRYKKFNIDSVILLATPNFGSNLAKVGEFFCDNVQAEDLAPGGVIDSMHDDWQRVFKEEQGVEPFIYSAGYELNPVKKLIFSKIIVEKYSAINFAQNIFPFLKDHITIAKPYGRDDVLYTWVRQRLLKQPVVRQARHRSDEEEKKIPETLEKIHEVAKGTELEEAVELIGIGNLDRALELLSKHERSGKVNLANTHYVTANVYKLKLNYYKAQIHFDKAVHLQQINREYLDKAGHNLMILGQYEKAIRYFEKALALDQISSIGFDHPNVYMDWNNLGLAWHRQGDFDKAIFYFEKALAKVLKAFGSDHPYVAHTWNNLGLSWSSKGDYEKAFKYYQMALVSNLKTFNVGHPEIANRWHNLGLILSEFGKHNEAIIYLETALTSDLNTFGPDHLEVIIDRQSLGSAWLLKGNSDKAIEYYEKAKVSFLKIFRPTHPFMAVIWNNLGGAWLLKRNYDKAIEYFEKALSNELHNFGHDHPNVATRWKNLGGAWLVKGNNDTAIMYFNKALTSNLKTLGLENPEIRDGWHNLGLAWHAKGEYDRAIEYFEKAFAIDLKSFGLDHSNIASDWKNLGFAWEAKGKYDHAIDYFEKALVVMEKRGLEEDAINTRKILEATKAKQRAGK